MGIEIRGPRRRLSLSGYSFDLTQTLQCTTSLNRAGHRTFGSAPDFGVGVALSDHRLTGGKLDSFLQRSRGLPTLHSRWLSQRKVSSSLVRHCESAYYSVQRPIYAAVWMSPTTDCKSELLRSPSNHACWMLRGICLAELLTDGLLATREWRHWKAALFPLQWWAEIVAMNYVVWERLRLEHTPTVWACPPKCSTPPVLVAWCSWTHTTARPTAAFCGPRVAQHSCPIGAATSYTVSSCGRWSETTRHMAPWCEPDGSPLRSPRSFLVPELTTWLMRLWKPPT